MKNKLPNFTIGVEEEYLVVDRNTRSLVKEVPKNLIEHCNKKLDGRVSPELLRSQIEVGTAVCQNIHEVGHELYELRQGISSIVSEHNLAIISSSTHPFSTWKTQKHTDADRYNTLARDLQSIVKRMLICGMHVHVGINDDDLRIDLMDQVKYFLPHLLALSTSSPFWEGHDSGLKSYRLSVWNEVPRTGLPEQFESYAEYSRYVKLLVDTKILEDATKVWWDIRPSARYPTLELRISDACTNLEDTLCVASLYCSLLRMLCRLRSHNQRWRKYSPTLIEENRWRAQRYGIDGGLIDFGMGRIVDYSDLLEEILELVAEDADALNCTLYVQHARNIIKNGTSAHHQLKVFENSLKEGASKREAFQNVVDMLIKRTLEKPKSLINAKMDSIKKQKMA